MRSNTILFDLQFDDHKMFIPVKKGTSVIIITFVGGLGNQMFQYAAGRCLSIILGGCALKLDISNYSEVSFRKFGLKHFNIKGKYIRETLFSRICYKIKLKSGIYSVYSESIPCNIKEFYRLPANIILNGYWQSENYFKPIEHIIREEFSIINSSFRITDLYMSDVLNSQSISLHIRRGDYIWNTEVNEKHGTCSIDYYKRGCEYIATKVDQPHFFIFSDDIKWVKNNFILNYRHTFIDINIEQIDVSDSETTDIAELYLMSLCKHNIIANSSFSWWGAWLNNNPDKIVVAPRKWFNDKSILDSENLIPLSWKRI